MALKFILGRSGSGKSTCILNQISKKQEENPLHNLILIVPEQFSLQAEKDIIRETKGKGIMQAKVLSFHRLAYTVFKETGMPNGTNLTDISRTMALKKILIKNKDSLLYFKKAADKNGFMDQLMLTISELFSYSVSTEKLLELRNKTEDNPVLAEKLSDIYLIYSEYKKFLQSGFVASEETLDILYNRIEGSKLIKNAEIWIDGFYGFTPQEFRIIDRLLSFASAVTVTLTMDTYSLNKKDLPMSHVFFETKDTFNRLLNLAKDCGSSIETTVLEEQKRFKTPALCALERQYPIAIVKEQESSEGIKIFAAANAFEEAEYTAQKIIELVRDKGYRYRDIAVLAASLPDYDSILKITMQECNIPYFMDNKREISNLPLVEFVKGMLEIVIYNLSFDSVFSFLKTGLTSIERKDIEILENYCLAYGIKGYKWNLENWSYGLTHGENKEEYLKINGLKNRFINILEPILSLDTKRSYSVAEISYKIYETFEKAETEKKLTLLIEKLSDKGETSKVSETKQCWNIISDTVDALVSLMGDENVTLKDYYSLLVSGLEAAKLGIIPPGIDNITIGTLERTRLPKVKTIFLLGVNDGVIPSTSSANGLLSDDERNTLEDLGIDLAHNDMRRAFEENYLIYSAITKAEENLFITYSVGDLSGKTMLPSSIISKIQKIFPNLYAETEISLAQVFSSPALAFHRLGDGLRSDEGKVWANSLDFFESNPVWSERTKLIKKGLNAVTPQDFLSEETSQRAFRGTLFSSVSKLERFSSCPYSYFLSYTMKAKERKVYQLGTPDLGLLFHAVIEDFSYCLKEQKLTWKDMTHDQIISMVEKSVDRQAPALGNEILLSTGAMQYLINRLKRICGRAIWTLGCHLKNGNFTPFDYELEFGLNGKLPPIAIDLENGDKMLLTGKIDRVDILKADGTTFVKIIDYKSGSKDFSLQEIYYGLQLQLLIYLDALIKNGNILGENPMPAGIFYFRIKDPMIRAEQILSIDDIENLLAKELKMSGLVLNDERVVTGLDNTSDKRSKIIPVEYSSKGGFTASSSLADEKTYKKLREYAVETAKSIGDRIKKGEISIKPYKLKGKTPCDYCSYRGICGFEENADLNIRNLKSLSDDEAVKMIVD